MVISSLDTRSHVVSLSGFPSWLNASFSPALGSYNSFREDFSQVFYLEPLFWTTSPDHLVKVLGKYCLIGTTYYLAGGFWNSVKHMQTLKVQPCILWFCIIPNVLILSLLYWCEEKSSVYSLTWAFSLLALSSLSLLFYCQLSEE